MKCWFCDALTPDPPPASLTVNGRELARLCAKHAVTLDKAFRGVGAYRYFAKIWVERKAAAVHDPPPQTPPIR